MIEFRFVEFVAPPGETVRLSELPGVEVQAVAESLYIHPFMLSRWRKQAREGQIVTKGVEIDKEVAAELKELRKITPPCEYGLETLMAMEPTVESITPLQRQSARHVFLRLGPDVRRP